MQKVEGDLRGLRSSIGGGDWIWRALVESTFWTLGDEGNGLLIAVVLQLLPISAVQ